eukprot:1159767-Pelagomonas_calceolata.AAC.7
MRSARWGMATLLPRTLASRWNCSPADWSCMLVMICGNIGIEMVHDTDNDGDIDNNNNNNNNNKNKKMHGGDDLQMIHKRWCLEMHAGDDLQQHIGRCILVTTNDGEAWRCMLVMTWDNHHHHHHYKNKNNNNR